MIGRVTLTLTMVLLGAMSFTPSFAGEHKGEKNLSPVTNETYKKVCGSCHFAYQPGLLPGRSWVKILDAPGGHQGGALSLERAAREEIRKYLLQNSAENSSAKRSRKILASLGSNSTPLRISETPYLREKHREIRQEAFDRKAVGSRGNCSACHKRAEQGVYEGDEVVLPEK